MSSVSGIGGQSIQAITQGERTSDKDMFLQLLVAEMAAQDPMKPMDNQSFMEQLSQFSAMEKTSEMNTSLEELIHLQSVLAAMTGLEKGATLLGKEVDYETAKGEKGTGTVKEARIEGNQVVLDLGDRTIRIGEVTGIRNQEAEAGSKSTEGE